MTETQVVEKESTEIIPFGIQGLSPANIAELKKCCNEMEIGPDGEGYEEVKVVHIRAKNIKTAIKNRHKDLKADALAVCQDLDEKKRRMNGIIEPIVKTLGDKRDVYDDKLKAIEEEKKRKWQEKIDDRMNSLAGYNAPLPYQEVAEMPDGDFANIQAEAERKWSEEQARIAEEKRIEDERLAKEAADRKAEEDRLEKIKLEQEEAAAKIKADQDELAEAQRKIDEEKAEIEREKQAEIDRKEREAFEKKAAENARIQAEKDAKEDAERAELEKAEHEQAEKEKAERQAALMPDMEKALAWIAEVEATPEFPTIQSETIMSVLENMQTQLEQIIDDARHSIGWV